ncbi:MAG: hypothetical protein AB7N80_00720 [Bdellovibrionales bacterium]
MKQDTRDQLVDCLEKLLSCVLGDEDPEIFIDRVAEEYLMALVREAHIPLRYLSTLRDDVRTEVMDLLRIRAYNYPSLKEYFLSRADQARRSA